MSTDFRALCRELTDFLAELPFGTCEELVARARAALAAPPAPPLKERPDFIAGYREGLADGRRIAEDEEAERHPAARPLLEKVARLGGVIGHQPAPAVETDAILTLAAIIREVDGNHSLGAAALAEAILSHRDNRWGHQPAPPAAGEVGELVAWLRAWALGTMEEGQPATSRSLTRTADLLAQRHPAPVPVSERLPELRGMFHRILCVARSSGQRPVGNIELADRLIKAVVSWSALPLPAGEVSDDR